MLADFEGVAFAKKLGAVNVADPVFISGLPRSGTTILLQIFTDSGHFAGHMYQDMPFVLCPILWSRFARHFRTEQTERERAHGDGLTISGQSPEGFEEIIWKYFWPDHYDEGAIKPWHSSERCDEFDEFYLGHMARIIAVRQGEREEAGTKLRYLSKNNVGISRLALSSEPLRNGVFLVPYRDPVQHAASLHRQHERFLRLQAADVFVHRYMEGIGHYDFGHGLRPIDFNGWLRSAPDPLSLDFWLEYWCAAYDQILADLRPGVHLVSYAQLTTKPEFVLRHLAAAVDVPAESLIRSAEKFRSPRLHKVDSRSCSEDLVKKAKAILLRLENVYREQSINWTTDTLDAVNQEHETGS